MRRHIVYAFVVLRDGEEAHFTVNLAARDASTAVAYLRSLLEHLDYKYVKVEHQRTER